MTKPTKPFEILFRVPRPGEKLIASQWAVPFDTEFREADILSEPEQAIRAYAALGAHVVTNSEDYTPAYTVVATITPADQKSPDRVKVWEATQSDNTFTITDRRTGRISRLFYAFSIREAAISWFVRELGHESSVLCYDYRDGVWYIEAAKSEFTLMLGADGSEVTADEDYTHSEYQTDKHPNAVMAYGE